MRSTLFAVVTTLIAATSLAQTPQKTFTEKLDGIKTTSKELVKNAGTDKSSIGQTGQMTTSVPLVTVSSRTMQFPLELRYAAGIKASQQSGAVGLGWALPLGSITRDYGAYEPDYSSTLHEADMIYAEDPSAALLKGKLASELGSTVNPATHGQYLGFDAIENVGTRPQPLSDKYHLQVPGFISNTFWNNGLIGGSHVWKLEDVENWKIAHTVKTYTISQEFSRINEVNLTTTNNTMNNNSSFAAAIGVYPYVLNGFARTATNNSNGFNPTGDEKTVRYEDFESFTITDDNGTRYVFGRALRGQKYVFSDDPYWSAHEASGQYSGQGQFWKVDYIAEWLLTEIQSVDYIDLNENGFADDGDAGDWIRFEYTEPTKNIETVINGAGNTRLNQEVPTYREWSNFSQTDQASSLMRELAYLTKIVTPVQEIDLTISERYEVDHDYYSKPANRVGNDYYYENRTLVTNGPTTDFDVNFPVETMKYDSIKVFSRLINKNIYANESNQVATIALNYAAKGSSQELAVSSYLIRNNDKQEKTVSGQVVGSPSSTAPFNMENYFSTTEKRGKTTLLGVDFYGARVHADEKTSYNFEYAYNPSYDEIHKREIVRKFFFPSVRQGSSGNNIPMPFNRASSTISYTEKRLNASGELTVTASHTNLSPYDFLIDYAYTERRYKFVSSVSSTNITSYVTGLQTTELYPLTNDDVPHTLYPIVDIYGYLSGSTNAPQAWSLTKITYPTGGQVSFEYENGSFTASNNWSIKETTVPVVTEYNALAKKRSYIQDAYNRYYASDYSGLSLVPKTLTASFETSLPTNYGIRLKKKTVNDRLNPEVVTNYEYENGQLTALPSEYLQAVYGGFNQFMIRENFRHSSELQHYLYSGVNEYTYDFEKKMQQAAHTNIALDDYSSIFYYSSIKTKYSDNSYLKTTYGNAVTESTDHPIYPKYNLYCFREPSSYWGGSYTLAGNNIRCQPIVLKSEELFATGASQPYQKTDYEYQLNTIGTPVSLVVEYSQDTDNPNQIKLWDNDFEAFYPDPQNGGSYMYSQLLIPSSLYLPFSGNSSYSYERWGQTKTLMTKKTTNYKGLIAYQEMTYDETAGFVLRQEKSYTLNEPNIYLTTYQYAHEFYNAKH